MRKAFLLVVCVCVAMMAVTTGCSNRKVEAADSSSTDSARAENSDTADTVDSATEVIASTPMPKAADQLFDDFFFNFIANRKLQRSRIKFPLPVVNGGKTSEPVEDRPFLPAAGILHTDFRQREADEVSEGNRPGQCDCRKDPLEEKNSGTVLVLPSGGEMEAEQNLYYRFQAEL